MRRYWHSQAVAERGILLSGHQFSELLIVGQLQPEKPTAAFGIAIDEGRVVDDRLIILDHFAAEGRIDVGSRFDRLHDSRFSTLAELRPDRWDLDEYYVTELLLRVIANANGGPISFNADPFVLFGVMNCHCLPSLR